MLGHGVLCGPGGYGSVCRQVAISTLCREMPGSTVLGSGSGGREGNRRGLSPYETHTQWETENKPGNHREIR